MTLSEPLFSMFAFKGRALGLPQMWLGITCRCACMQVWVCVSEHECAGVSVCGENLTVLWPWRANRCWYKDSSYACVCCSLFLRIQTTSWHLRGHKEIARVDLFRWPCSRVSSGIFSFLTYDIEPSCVYWHSLLVPFTNLVKTVNWGNKNMVPLHSDIVFQDGILENAHAQSNPCTWGVLGGLAAAHLLGRAAVLPLLQLLATKVSCIPE